MARDDNYNRMTRCSFCGKSEAMVHKLIEGPGVFICDECIRLCNDLIQSTELADAPGKQGEDGDMVLPAGRDQGPAGRLCDRPGRGKKSAVRCSI